ncbi:Pectin acetylesterase 9 [Diplonema papillatum]|nr:Pectin acetylesterase 9 [Diplonema papillatum]
MVFATLLAAAVLSTRSYEYISLNNDDARCLDGSFYGIMVCQGAGSNGKGKWVLSFQGGGWCYNEKECAERAATALGSSATYPAVAAGKSCVETGDATTVEFAYCDGASFSGNVLKAYQYNSSFEMYFRGNRNMDVGLDYLFAHYGLANADTVIVSGGSAGGLTTFLHADHIASRLPATTRVVGNPTCGFFIDHGNDGYEASTVTYPLQMQYVYLMQNASSSLSQECQNDLGWKCIMAPHAVKYIKTPMFISQSRFDQWQLDNELFLPCLEGQSYGPPYKPGVCNATENDSIQNWGKYLMDQLNYTQLPSSWGGWVDACIIHGVSTGSIDGKTNAQAFDAWLTGNGTSHWSVFKCNGSEIAGPCNTAPDCAPFPA